MNKLIVSATLIGLFFASSLLANPAELLPANAKPGECYARVFTPPQYKETNEKVVIQQASEKIEIVPAQYETVEEKVMIEEPSFKLETVAPTYKIVEEKVMVKPASKKLVEMPAVFETVVDRVVDQPAHTVWKKGRGPIEQVDNSTGDIMCLVDVPATYKEVKKQVVKSPASTKIVEVPAEFQVIKKKVIDQPATTKKIEIPAKYVTVKVQKLVKAAEENRSPVPERIDNVKKTVKVAEGSMEWKQVLCETNMTPEVIKPIQAALKTEGLYGGPIDGSMGATTVNSIKAYQKKHNLAEGGITIETINKLKVASNTAAPETVVQ